MTHMCSMSIFLRQSSSPTVLPMCPGESSACPTMLSSVTDLLPGDLLLADGQLQPGERRLSGE